ncbi:type 2 lantipeptide synthetase LanM [Ktedonosporobacter rubrisoli]|uniref:Type 2 lantipeptide synthetase LanM n=1 Tax=Ktedonosporobacter rubrisoli TaxID=2509675 RepID=A0A4P6JRB5_KTERU|nr:type 2 lanthipeptide synthetase LanM family protein [Ktedonosporobacter rubrisoli]QBD77336.1 type 2 lantipeptide synthetase LanM [Ktedonosporobacter rubrisoli]
MPLSLSDLYAMMGIASGTSAADQELSGKRASLPNWTNTLQDVLRLVEMMAGESVMLEKRQWSFLDLSNPSPFEEILAPFIGVAQQRYMDQAGAAAYLLTEKAHLSLQRSLLQILTSLSIQALHTAFQAYAQGYWRSAGRLDTIGKASANEEMVYQRFIEQMYAGGLITFLRKYYVLAQLLATTVDLWVNAHIEFLQRLAADWQDIQQIFGKDTEIGNVITIQPTLSDPHTGRRCVMALQFASGLKLVYKPKNIGLEAGYYDLLNWCNMQGLTPPMKILPILKRVEYGWVEFVQQEPCQDFAATQRYCQRVGMLLCIVYLLGGTNCFHEHLVAHGEYPVLVDPEVLLHTSPCFDSQESALQAQSFDWEQASYSVLHTGLLPTWQQAEKPSAGGQYSDISGFAMAARKKIYAQEDALTLPFRQDMILAYGSLKPRPRYNTAMYRGCPLQLEEQSNEVSNGFRRMYQLIFHYRTALLAEGSSLLALHEQSVRVISRAPREYRDLLPKLLTPQALSDQNRRHFLLKSLENMGGAAKDSLWQAIIEAEKRALLQGDIPVFRLPVEKNLPLVAHMQAGPFRLHQSAFDLLQARLNSWCEADMQFQLHLLQRALRRDITSGVVSSVPRKATEDGPASAGELNLDFSDILLPHAWKIANDIAMQAIPLGDGGVTWVGAQFLKCARCHQLRSMGFSLFQGTAGIALFLAAIAKISEDASYLKLVGAALQPIQQMLHGNGQLLAQEMGIGGAVGIGSLVYTFTRISQLLDDARFLASAQDVARLITAEEIAADRRLDIVSGTAGALLGLLALHERTGDQWVLDRAILCGKHLLQTRTMSAARCQVWPTYGGTHHTGFSHGVAGIVYALLRLYAVARDADLLDAAREGLIYEDGAFRPEVENWAEELGERASKSWMTWCHGAPGIGLARIGGLPLLASPQIQRDIEAALQTTKRFGVQAFDHLCCGNSGRTELLWTAALHLKRSDLAEIAQQHIVRMIIKAEQRGAFALPTFLPAWASLPHFFHGTSGIGYTLLRMLYPELLPSVLLWE